MSFAQTYFAQGFALSRRAYDALGGPALPRIGNQGGVRAVQAARAWAAKINAQRDPDAPGARPATAGELMALALLTEIQRELANDYALWHNPGVFERGRRFAESSIGPEATQEAHLLFVNTYPPEVLLDSGMPASEYLADRQAWPLRTEDLVAREALLVTISNGNTAAQPYRPLFDDTEINRHPSYRQWRPALETFLRCEPPHPATGLNLVDTLWAPVLAAPDDLEAQLHFIRDAWGEWLPKQFMERLQLAGGTLREERTMRGHGPGPVQALSFRGLEPGPGGGGGDYPEPEAFSRDLDWMPNVVLMAKSTYVWLDQLSRRYGRAIHRLDQVPDEELDQLARWGVTALWLIGLWERSCASRDIKRRMGNSEAEASAYSLYDYAIATDLGGEEACRNLAERAWRRGIRLASDMVPNHVGLYSHWTMEHPDWFIQSDTPPFPNYTFNGPDLSPDDRLSVVIEDGYWDRRDAAVVFKHHDHRTGRTRYIYHGNDGTSMPWNDTAQLNYLLPEVRRAVIETIIHVARQFPIIRFDAAMTLAKKHYQRLWFPKPGEGGAIPSRAEHGMTQEEFDAVFPVEFWREVVDTIAQEAPDTLLLAEAFWLMEGYFVRTLGMHRVYNSAFMNMLKMEDNAKFRETIANVLEYSPAILQRFVNFMNNPDEDTAEAQFGKGDKYFGVAVLLVTLPGLPMLGHGQIEGLSEKYGMEYRRALRDEPIDQALVERHEREIFPLMRLRWLFSGAEHFALFDCTTAEGGVSENVIVFTNRAGQDRAFVAYNNAFASAQGTVHWSRPFNEGPAETPQLRQWTLAEALDLDVSPNTYYIYRDSRTGLEYLEHAERIAQQGLSVSLQGYQYIALLDWRAVVDTDLSWAKLHEALGGRGVPSMDDAYMERALAPLLEPFVALLAPAHIEALRGDAGLPPTFDAAFDLFFTRAAEWAGIPLELAALRRCLDASRAAVRGMSAEAETYDDTVLTLWALLQPLEALARQGGADDPGLRASEWMRDWFLSRQLAKSLTAAHGDAWLAGKQARLVRAMLRNSHGLATLSTCAWGPFMDAIAQDAEMRELLGVNHFNGHRWLHRESLEELLRYLKRAIRLRSENAASEERLLLVEEDAQTLADAAGDVGYDFDAWVECVK